VPAMRLEPLGQPLVVHDHPLLPANVEAARL